MKTLSRLTDDTRYELGFLITRLGFWWGRRGHSFNTWFIRLGLRISGAGMAMCWKLNVPARNGGRGLGSVQDEYLETTTTAADFKAMPKGDDQITVIVYEQGD